MTSSTLLAECIEKIQVLMDNVFFFIYTAALWNKLTENSNFETLLLMLVSHKLWKLVNM